LSTAADLRLASPRARWRWVGPGHGLAVGSWVLPELVGRSRALELTLTGRWLRADEAAAIGFARTTEDPWADLADVLETLAGARASQADHSPRPAAGTAAHRARRELRRLDRLCLTTSVLRQPPKH